MVDEQRVVGETDEVRTRLARSLRPGHATAAAAPRGAHRVERPRRAPQYGVFAGADDVAAFGGRAEAVQRRHVGRRAPPS